MLISDEERAEAPNGDVEAVGEAADADQELEEAKPGQEAKQDQPDQEAAQPEQQPKDAPTRSCDRRGAIAYPQTAPHRGRSGVLAFSAVVGTMAATVVATGAYATGMARMPKLNGTDVNSPFVGNHEFQWSYFVPLCLWLSVMFFKVQWANQLGLPRHLVRGALSEEEAPSKLWSVAYSVGFILMTSLFAVCVSDVYCNNPEASSYVQALLWVMLATELFISSHNPFEKRAALVVRVPLNSVLGWVAPELCNVPYASHEKSQEEKELSPVCPVAGKKTAGAIALSASLVMGLGAMRQWALPLASDQFAWFSVLVGFGPLFGSSSTVIHPKTCTPRAVMALVMKLPAVFLLSVVVGWSASSTAGIFAMLFGNALLGRLSHASSYPRKASTKAVTNEMEEAVTPDDSRIAVEVDEQGPDYDELADHSEEDGESEVTRVVTVGTVVEVDADDSEADDQPENPEAKPKAKPEAKPGSGGRTTYVSLEEMFSKRSVGQMVAQRAFERRLAARTQGTAARVSAETLTNP